MLNDIKINYGNTFDVSHSRDYYKGKSFHFAGEWKQGAHYINDPYVTDFVTKDNALLACRKSHMSSSANKPVDWVEKDGEKYGIVSDYWDLVIAGVTGGSGGDGGVYLPSYEEENDRLVWTLVPSEDLESPIYVTLGLNGKINEALGPIQSQIGNINDSIGSINSEINNINGDITNLQLTTTHISSDLSGLENRVEDAEGNIGQLWLTAEEFGVKMEDAEGNIGQLLLTAREFSVEMSNLQGDVGRLWLTAQEFGVRMSNAEGDVSLLKQTADEIQTRVENAEGDISQIHQRADEIWSQVENNQGDISQLHQRADEIWSQVENNQGDISRISQRADEIQSQVENNAGDISTISQRADQIATQVENFAGDISRIEQRADSIEATVANAEGDISQLRQTATEISSRVSNAEGDISTIQQTAQEISSRVENAEGDISSIRQTADEISTRVENNAGDISELRQTASEISSTVESNKILTDGAIAENRSLISQTADQIRSEVESNITRLDGSIEEARSEIRQTAEEITSTVERNKIETDGAIDAARSEIRQTADEISATVERNKQETDGSIEELRSNITQTAEEISATVEANRIATDGAIENLSSEITQTAEQITSTVEANRISAEGAIDELSSRITQTAEEITSVVESNKVATDGAIEQLSSTISQTASEIRSEVSSAIADVNGNIESARSEISQTASEISALVETNKQLTDAEIENLSSQITQTAEGIRSEVSREIQDASNQTLEAARSEIQQTADSILSTVELTKTEIDGQLSTLESVQVQQADLIASKVSQTDYDIDNAVRETRFSTIEQTADTIESTVAANKVDADNKIIDLSTRITQTEDSIISVVNVIESLDGTINNQQSQINQLSNEIDLKVSQTEFDNKTGSIDQSISDILLDNQGIHNSVSALSGELDNTAIAFNNYVSNTNGLLEALQNQVDGAIETWFYEGVPTLSNLPASEWTTVEDKNTHIGDLYYDKLTEYAYRFMLEDGVYQWERIADSDIATAIRNAAAAQTTADGKMKVFVTTPTPPYQVGDLWVQGSTQNQDGMIYKCIVPKEEGQAYSASDWAIAFDAVTTKVIKSSFDIFADAIQGRVWQQDPNGIISGNTYSSVKQTIDNINLSVVNVRNDLLATGIDISGVQYDQQGHVIQGGTVTITSDNFILQGNQPGADRALTLVYDSNGIPRISASNLEIEGVFSTTAWGDRVSALNSTAQGYANAAQAAAESNAQGYANTAQQNAIDSANAYTDSEIQGAKDYADGVASTAEDNAKGYTDAREVIIKAYADNVGSSSVTSAQTYFNNIVYGNGGSAQNPTAGSILGLINGLDNDILGLGNSYSDLYDQINTGNNSIVSQINALSGYLTDLGYLAEALWNGDTVTAGGLILSSLIQLGSKHSGNSDSQIDGSTNQSNWRVWSGLNGIYDSTAPGGGIAAWYGGAMLDRAISGNTDANRAAKSLFRFDGSGYLANNNIYWDALGNLTVGGYILTHEVQVGYQNGNNWTVMAGISGDYDTNDAAHGYGIAAWYGGPKVDWKALTPEELADPTTKYAQSLFRMDGSGYLAGGELQWGANGELIIHGDSIQIQGDNAADSITVQELLELKSWFTKEHWTDSQGTHYYLRLNQSATGLEGLAADGFISAGGLSNTGGSSGVDMIVVWESLTNTSADTTYNNTKIHRDHLPIASSSAAGIVKIGSGLSIAADGTLSAASGTVTSIGLSMPTGFTVTSSPITSNGTIAVTFASGYSLPTTSKQTNWDTAYSWGNHANAGYLTDVTVTSSNADIGTSLTTIASVHGTDIKAKITHQTLGLYAGNTGGTANASVSNPYILLVGGGSNKGNVRISGSGSVSVASASGTITITGTDTKYKLSINGTVNGDSAGTSLGTVYAPTSAGTSGQILIANASGVPTWSDQSNISELGTITVGTWNANVIGVQYGGTGLNSIAAGEMLYGSSANTIGKISANATNTKKFLSQTSSGAPTWSAVTQADVFGSSDIGSTSLPVYYNHTNGFSTITSLAVSGNISTSGGNLSVAGTSTLNGAVTVGTAQTNAATTLNGTLSVNGTITARNIVSGGTASTTGRYDIGTSTNFWRYVYANRFYLTDTIYFVVDEHGVKLEGAGFYTDSFVSAGGYSDAGGSSGIDWIALTTAGEEQIHKSHIANALTGYVNIISNTNSGDFVESISKAADSSILSVTYGTFPSSVKNPHSLIFGSKSYDGSVDVSLVASDLGISSWALAASKPSYSLSEISGTTDLQLIEALTGSGFLKRTSNNTWTLDNSTYLTTSSASSTYLTKTDASSTYLTITDAADTYLTIANAGSNYQPLDSDLTAIAAISTGTGLLKRTVSGSTVTWTIDTNQYITGNQTITLSGDVTGSGTTSIVTTIGEGKVTNAMLAGSIANNKLANSSITINGSAVSLGGSFSTASITAGTAGQSTASTGSDTITIPYITVNKYGIVTAYGTHTHTIDDLPNSALQYSSITIGNTTISLGGSSTTLAGLSKVTSTTYSAGGKLEDNTTESTITYDATNHAWKITGNLYATGFISAGGLSDGSGTSGIDWGALSTEGEEQIHSSHLSDALTGYVNAVSVTGSGNYVSSITKSGSTITVNLSTLPTTSSWASITDKPTTLSGYGITDGVNAVTVTGSGNAVTTASISGHTLTLTKGTTFLTTHQTVTLTSGTNNGTLKLTVGSTVTDNIAVKGLGAAAYKAIGSVASGNTGLVTGGDVYSAINDIVTSAIKFRGVTTSTITDGSTTNTITIDGNSYTAQTGDLVLSGGLEFVWTGSKWQLLGDESSYVPKTTTVNGHALSGNVTVTASDVGLGNVTNLAASGYFTVFAMDTTDTTKTSITIGGTNKKLVIGYATKAAQDASGNTITSNYGASLSAASNALSLVSKSGATLSTITAANIVTVLGNTTVNRAVADKNGNDIYATYVSSVAVGTGDNASKLAITKNGSTTHITVPYATLANTVTTTADTSNTLYLVGVTSSATTTLKRNTGITMKNGALNVTSLSASTSITAPKIYLNANTYFELDSDGYVHLVHPTGKGFYADGFVSAGGISTSGSGSGGSVAFVDYATIKTLNADDDFTTASAWATHLFYQDVFGSGNTTITSRISALENSSTNVSYTASQSSGTLLGTITIDGNANQIYAPTIPTSLKNPHALTIGSSGKSYDGSQAKTINAEDLSACVMGTIVGTVTITT